MKKIALIALSALALSASSREFIAANSRIFVAADDGFGIYLTAALEKKQVPLTVTVDKAKADYELDGVSEHDTARKSTFFRSRHSDDDASVQLVDIRTGDVVFAYSVDKKSTLHGRQTVAESVAKHLREMVIGGSGSGSGPDFK
jgi:hypothetical protein